MQFIDKKIKLSTIFPNKKSSSKNTTLVPIKVIPPYIENEERLMERRLIINYHNIFKKEKGKNYKGLYLDKVFNGLHHNKRNYSFQRNQHHLTNISQNKSTDSFPLLTRESSKKLLTIKQNNSQKVITLLKNRSSCNDVTSKEAKVKKHPLLKSIPFPPMKCL